MHMKRQFSSFNEMKMLNLIDNIDVALRRLIWNDEFLKQACKNSKRTTAVKQNLSLIPLSLNSWVLIFSKVSYKRKEKRKYSYPHKVVFFFHLCQIDLQQVNSAECVRNFSPFHPWCKCITFQLKTGLNT